MLLMLSELFDLCLYEDECRVVDHLISVGAHAQLIVVFRLVVRTETPSGLPLSQ